MARYVSHEERIVDAAVESLLPLPEHPDPRFVEGMLAGFTRALDAIGSSVTVVELTPAGGAR